VAAPYSLPPGAEAPALAGAFEVTLVATSGDSSGREVRGRLLLEATGRQGVALVGRTDVDPRRVNAYRNGALDVSGDSAPGIVVFQRGVNPASIMLRLGADVNALGVQQPIEGSFTILLVHRIDSGGFAGPWRSGDNLERAAGHFCAVRVVTGAP